ncbi:MAG: NAD+ synthase [Gammaproteobacteria bacterium]|nr:NAD+ synthase [Gammaproteobacteria bacterium]
MQASQLKVALAQINTMVGATECNVDKIIERLQHARDELLADVIVFPELTLTGYPPEDLLLRPGLSLRALKGLERLCKAVTGIDVVVGYPAQTTMGIHNTAVLIRDGEIIAQSHKQHLPNYSVFDEKRYFIPGTEAPAVVEIKGIKAALLVCEDIWEPEPIAQAKQAGAELVLVLNASPYHQTKGREREDIVRSRIEEAGMPLVYVNQVGGQDELVFDGESFVMDAQGALTLRAPAFVEGTYLAEFDVVAGVQLAPKPGEITPPLSMEASVYQALVVGVRDYIEKNGFRGVVLGLSGGIDSALTLAVAVDAIGAERVEAVMMPTRYTRDMSLEDARAEADILGVNYQVLPIEPIYQQFLDTLSDEFAGTAVDTTEENLQARCRGVLLMAISNKKHKIVLTTGNKSEMAVGYATLYGDMAGGFDVLKDVPKTLVFSLSEYRNTLSQVIPQRVIDRPPSAELAPEQEDTDSLPPYEELDVILQMYVEEDKCLEDIVAAGYDEDTVRRVIRLVDRNEYKRRQAAPGVRITRRAFGRDRRYPITSGYGSDT